MFVLALLAFLAVSGGGGKIQPDAVQQTSLETGNDMKSVIAEFEQILVAGEFHAQPKIGNTALEIKEKIPSYLKLLADLKKDAHGMQIDFIFMAHGIPSSDSEKRVTLKSQEIVLKILEQERYELIGYEGSSAEKVTVDSLASEAGEIIANYFCRLDPHMTALPAHNAIVEAIRRNLQFDSVIAFGEKNPEANIIGMEDPILHRYHAALLGFVGGRYQTTPEWQKMDEMLHLRVSETRSIVALSKMVARMKKDGKTRAVIVIGTSHAEGMRMNSAELKLRSRFFTTTSR